MNSGKLYEVLKEFPWLWAIKQSWHYGIASLEVTVHRISESELRHMRVLGREQANVWVFCHTRTSEHVLQVSASQLGRPLAVALAETIHSGQKISHFVVDILPNPGSQINPDLRHIMIYKPPKSAVLREADMHQFVCEIAFPDLVNQA